MDDLEVGSKGRLEHGVAERPTFGDLAHEELDDNRKLVGLVRPSFDTGSDTYR